MRPETAAEVREWLERAVDDIREAEHDLTASPPLVRGAVFHSQQAAEKVLKAFLTAHDRSFPRTHDLEAIGQLVLSLDPALQNIVEQAQDLTPYAWRFRYPGTPVSPTEDEAREVLTIAREAYDAVFARLHDSPPSS